MEIEKRYYQISELRADGKTIRGKIPYNSLSRDLGNFKERLQRGCFADSLKSGAKVMAFWNHDTSTPLGSTSAGTLRVDDRADALHFTIHPPPNQWGDSVMVSVKRGDVDGCSFGFRCLKDEWTNTNIRTIISAELLEISPCSFPAYPETSVRSRGATMYTKELRDLYEQRAKVLTEMRALQDSDNYDAEKYQRMEADFDKFTREIELAKKEELLSRSDNEVIRPIPGAQEREQRERGQGSDPWQGKAMRIIRPGEKRQAPKPSEVEARDIGRFFAVGAYNLTDAEKQRFEIRRVLQADKDVTGGFAVLPESYSSQILTELNDAVFIRSLGTQIELKNAASLSVPYDDDAGDDASWTAEIFTGAEDASISFEKRNLAPKPSAKRVKLSRTLAQRAAGFQNFAISRLSYKFALTEEKAFLTGDGVGKPMGIFIAAGAGALGISTARDVSTGNTSTEIKADNLIETLMSLKAQYRKNAVWVFHRDAIKQIRKLKTGDGVYLLQPSLAADKPDTILGKVYHESEYAPNTFTSGLYVGILGDFSYYWVVTALSMEVSVLTELYAEQNCIGLIGRMEVDAAPILENAFARVKLA